MLNTETPSQLHAGLDEYSTLALVAAFVDDQRNAVRAVREMSRKIADAVDAAVPRMAAGGRLIYAGAGTSGRLGVMDSAELYPTFSWPKARAIGLIAGGSEAMSDSVEGAEDSIEQGAADVRAADIGPDDVLLLITASGATPYVMGALQAGRQARALIIGMANNLDSPLIHQADIAIALDTGHEVISGSTRLKAGTAQKIALNTFSSALMVRLNKVYGNLMVDLKASNAKLLRRALSLTMLASGADEASASAALDSCDFHVKVAIVMLRRKLGAADARALLAKLDGSVRAALAG